MMYRARQVMHIWSMQVFQLLVPTMFLGIEGVIVVTLFVAIKVGYSEDFLVAIFALSIGSISLYGFKAVILFSVRVTETSAELIQDILHGPSITKANKLALISCGPLELRVGSTFTITDQTLPTVVQDIIIGNLINLLVTFR